MKRSKRYKALERKEEAFSSMGEAIKWVRSQTTAKFDESIDIAFKLNLQKKHFIRDTVVFPHSFGEAPKVLVFAKGKKAEEAKTAGADFVGDEDLITKIQSGWVDFQVAMATPDMMKSVAKVARVLGTKGLMPNPKAKTVTDDIQTAVKAVKAGRKEFKATAEGVINFSIGKKSMKEEHLINNALSFVEVVKRKEPTDIKGDYVKSIHITSTMGSAVELDHKNLKMA